MTAGEMMTKKFEMVQANAGLDEVARKLESSGMSLLPVCQDELLVGMVSLEDVAGPTLTARRGLEPIRVADVIAADLVYCYETTDVLEAAKLMRESRVSLLAVLGPGKKVVGVLTLESIPAATATREV